MHTPREDPYRRLDTLPAGFPATPTCVELRILCRLFTPEEARLAVHLTSLLETPTAIARTPLATIAYARRTLARGRAVPLAGQILRMAIVPSQPAGETRTDRMSPVGLAGMTGFEPAISALTGQRVGPLHHTPERPLVYHA